MAENIRQKLVHLHTSEKKVPTKDILELGEIAVQHNNDEAALYIKKNDGTIAKFIDDSAVDTKIAVETTRAEGIEDGLADRIRTLEGSNHTHENKDVLDGIDANKVAAWSAAEANAISSAKTYTDATIEALNLASTYEAKGTAQNLIDGLNLAGTYAKKEVEGKISTLIGSDTNKSVRSVAAEEVAKIVNSADTRYDTLKEIADWIISDTTGAASMANDINALKAISADTRLVKLEGKSHSHKNLDLLETYTQTNADLADAVTKKHTHENKGVLDGITAVKVSAWDAAKADAILSAKTYTDSVASGKANTVHTHAIADVTGLQGALDGKAASAHTHAIADVTGLQSALDGKDSKGAAAQALTDAKTYVDGKVDGKFDAAGAAAKALTDAKSYADGLNTAMDGRVDVLEASSHTHENKGVLDKITDAKVTAWDAAEGNAKKYTDDKIAVLKIDCGTY